MTSLSRPRALLLSLVVSLTATAFSSPTRADDSLTRLRETLKREPKAPEVVKMALDYYRVSPEIMESLRSSARARGLIPVISAFSGYQSAGTSTAQAQTITNPFNLLVTTGTSSWYLNAGLAFDPRELIFNPAELQTYASIPMQKDITLEIVRTYYLRRQLQIRLAIKPPTDPLAVATLELRAEEYAALLNAMTGGAFERAAAAGGRPKPE